MNGKNDQAFISLKGRMTVRNEALKVTENEKDLSSCIGANISGILLVLPKLTRIVVNLYIREDCSLDQVQAYYLT